MHFFPILVAPDDQLVGIRVVLVIRGIVIVRNSDNASAFGQRERLGEVIAELPIKIPFRFENGFRFS